jgi:hypothetical protein
MYADLHFEVGDFQMITFKLVKVTEDDILQWL